MQKYKYFSNILVAGVLFCLMFPPLAQGQGSLDDIIMASTEEPRVRKRVQSEIPKRLTRKFRRDAARLALRIEAKNEDLRYQNIVIPQNTIEKFFEI